MTASRIWSLDASSGELRILTGVAGPAAKTGHRLTIAMQSWQATVHWQGDEPQTAELIVDVDSLEVLKGEGGVAPFLGPEKGVARSNALKSLDAEKFPQIRFTTDDITPTAGGYRLSGAVEIHGKRRPQVVDLNVGEKGKSWTMSAQVRLTQSEFGVKPFSLLMGAVKVADEVTIDFAASYVT